MAMGLRELIEDALHACKDMLKAEAAEIIEDQVLDWLRMHGWQEPVEEQDNE